MEAVEVEAAPDLLDVEVLLDLLTVLAVQGVLVHVLLDVRGGPWAVLASSLIGKDGECARVSASARCTVEHCVIGIASAPA